MCTIFLPSFYITKFLLLRWLLVEIPSRWAVGKSSPLLISSPSSLSLCPFPLHPPPSSSSAHGSRPTLAARKPRSMNPVPDRTPVTRAKPWYSAPEESLGRAGRNLAGARSSIFIYCNVSELTHTPTHDQQRGVHALAQPRSWASSRGAEAGVNIYLLALAIRSSSSFFLIA